MVTIFVVCWVITLIYAIRLILSLSSSTANYGVIEGKQVIRRVPHPEMMEVKPGDELMVVKFGDEEPKDELHEELKNRIEELEDIEKKQEMLKRIQDLDRLREEKQAKRPTGHSSDI